MISLLLPSRWRPQQLVEMWHTAIATADDPDDIEMVVRIDDDDDSYDLLRSRGARDQVRWVVGKRDTMSALWNDSWQHARGDIFMHCADDIRFRNPGWDLRVKMHIDRFPSDRIGFVYGRDGGHDQALGTHGFITKEWCDIVEYFLPPYFTCDWADQWLFDVAGIINRRIYDPEIFTEHMHPAFGKGPMDRTHIERLARDVADDNTGKWLSLQPVLHQWAAKLRLAKVDG